MTRICIVSLAIGSLLFAALPETRAADLRQACQSDAQQFCGGTAPGDWHMMKCLRQNKSQLSQPCQAALQTAMAEVRACRADARQLCAGVPPGGGVMLQCLEQHQSSLSPDCANRLASAHGGDSGANPPPTGQSFQ